MERKLVELFLSSSCCWTRILLSSSLGSRGYSSSSSCRILLPSLSSSSSGHHSHPPQALVLHHPLGGTFATRARPKEEPASSSASLTPRGREEGAVTLSVGEKVKENVKTGGYGVVLLAGLAVTGGLLWVLLSELFSSDSPNNIYTHAFKLCKLSPDVQDALGTPLKCYGEETRRGWRRHVSHVEFQEGGDRVLRMKFYIEGTFGRGTVHVEKRKKNNSGPYEYRYILVDKDYPPRQINVRF